MKHELSVALRSTGAGQIVEPRVETKHDEAAFRYYATQTAQITNSYEDRPKCKYF